MHLYLLRIFTKFLNNALAAALVLFNVIYRTGTSAILAYSSYSIQHRGQDNLQLNYRVFN